MFFHVLGPLICHLSPLQLVSQKILAILLTKILASHVIMSHKDVNQDLQNIED